MYTDYTLKTNKGLPLLVLMTSIEPKYEKNEGRFTVLNLFKKTSSPNGWVQEKQF